MSLVIRAPSPQPYLSHPRKHHIEDKKTTITTAAVSKADDNKQSPLQIIHSWLDNSERAPLEINNISYDDFVHLDEQLQKEGIKTRQDWDESERRVTIWMPKSPHDKIGCWLAGETDGMTVQVRRGSLCGKHVIAPGGTTNVELHGANGKFIYQPDEQLMLRDKGHPKRKIVPISTIPRVVLETAYSQTLPHVMEKTWNYLHCSNGEIHAVIICKMEGEFTLSDFKVTFGVWKRDPPDDSGM